MVKNSNHISRFLSLFALSLSLHPPSLSTMHFTFDVDAIMPYPPSTDYHFNSSARDSNNLFDHIKPAKGQGSIVLGGEVHCPQSHLTKAFDRYEAPGSPPSDSLSKSTKLHRQLSTTTTDSSGSLRTLCSQCESVSLYTWHSLDSLRWFEWSPSTDRSIRGTTLLHYCQLVTSSNDDDDDDEEGTTSRSYSSNESARSFSLVSSLLSFWAFPRLRSCFADSPFAPSLVTPSTSKINVLLALGVDTVTITNWILLNSRRFDEGRNGILVVLFNMDYNVQRMTLASVRLPILSRSYSRLIRAHLQMVTLVLKDCSVENLIVLSVPTSTQRSSIFMDIDQSLFEKWSGSLQPSTIESTLNSFLQFLFLLITKLVGDRASFDSFPSLI